MNTKQIAKAQAYYRETFGYERGQFPNAEAIGDRTISLPFYPEMPEDHVHRVIDAVRGIVESAPD